MDGVLRSWAVPKEPPQDAGTKRLAVAVEDHPLGYEKFKGTIPEGRYGAGTVAIWDEGTYEIADQKKDALVIIIHGRVLKGIYCLIKLKKDDGRDKNWLFFKKSGSGG